MRIWLVMLCRRVFFYPLISSSSSLPLSPFFLCRSRDLCALYYCLAMRPDDSTLLQSCAHMQRIHSLRGIYSMQTGLLNILFAWGYSRQQAFMHLRQATTNVQESSCGFGNCCLNSNQFCFPIPSQKVCQSCANILVPTNAWGISRKL